MNEPQLLSYIASTSPHPDLQDIFDRVDFSQRYPNLEALIVNLKIATAVEFRKSFAKARRRSAIIAQLGTVPNTTAEFITALCDLAGYRIEPNTQVITWTCPFRRVRSDFEQDILLEWALDHNRNLLDNQFHKSDVAGQIEFLARTTNEAIRAAIWERITQLNAAFDWDALIARCFDSSTIPGHIQAAILMKFIWMVKRRMAGLPVTHHVLPVIYGSQGCGKSEFVKRFMAIVGPLGTTADFGRVADNREGTLFKSYVVFLDEMQKADRAEMAAVKDVITRDTFSYRPMGTNASISVQQKASFIGTSNKLLQQLITDPTGNRRFFQLDFNSESGQPEWDYINGLDFAAMWSSVDHTAVDPSLPYFADIRAIADTTVVQTTVEQFADHLMANAGLYLSASTAREEPTRQELPMGCVNKDVIYLAYRDYCTALRIGKPYEQQSFLGELHRLVKHKPGFPIQPRRTKQFNGWEYQGPRPATSKAGAVIARIEPKRGYER